MRVEEEVRRGAHLVEMSVVLCRGCLPPFLRAVAAFLVWELEKLPKT